MEEFDLFEEGLVEEGAEVAITFMDSLSFSMIPFVTALIFALLAPPLGATLAMRDESVSAISLPIAGTAIIALFITFGIHPHQTYYLYPLALLSLFALMTIIHTYSSRSRSSSRFRTTILAATFVVSNTIILLVKAKSTHVENLFDTILEGDLLVGEMPELLTTAFAGAFILIGGTLFRGQLYTFAIDADLLKSQKMRYKRTMLFHRFSTAMVITGGILFIGPLLTTGLLIIPGFLMERYSRGLTSFMISTMFVGFFGCMAGLLGSLHFDMSPAPVAVAGVLFLSLIGRYTGKLLT